MKKRSISYSVIIILITALLGACSVSKDARKMKHNITGDWVLETLITDGETGKIKDKIFNEADFSCFIASEWNFTFTNKMGSYAIIDKQKNCPVIKRHFSWSYAETKDSLPVLLLRRLDEKHNPVDKESGFILTITQLDKKQMKLKADIIFEGRPASIIYNFEKSKTKE
jgi:Lipocalin-like domain